MKLANLPYMKLVVVIVWSLDPDQGSRISARDSCIGEKILCDSYTSIVPSRSISYAWLAFYPGEEAVMFGLLLALVGFVLMSLFIAYECLCGRV